MAAFDFEQTDSEKSTAVGAPVSFSGSFYNGRQPAGYAGWIAAGVLLLILLKRRKKKVG